MHAIGHQWWWEFRYPDLNIVTANEMHVPVGSHVNVSVESADVIHSFWVPELGGKMDAIPGQVNKVGYTITDAVVLDGKCSEFAARSMPTCCLRSLPSRRISSLLGPKTSRRWLLLPAGRLLPARRL